MCALRYSAGHRLGHLAALSQNFIQDTIGEPMAGTMASMQTRPAPAALCMAARARLSTEAGGLNLPIRVHSP